SALTPPRRSSSGGPAPATAQRGRERWLHDPLGPRPPPASANPLRVVWRTRAGHDLVDKRFDAGGRVRHELPQVSLFDGLLEPARKVLPLRLAEHGSILSSLRVALRQYLLRRGPSEPTRSNHVALLRSGERAVSALDDREGERARGGCAGGVD